MSNEPTLLSSHLQFVKGAVEETIGNVSGSTAWQESGASDKSAGIDGMKAASANRDPATDGYGKLEEIAGKVTGCEGMEVEGAQSKGGEATGENERLV